MGNAELAEQHLLGHPASPLVAQMKGAAVRGAGLTNQLLAFARKQIIQPRILDLNELLERAAEMLRPIIGERIEIVVHADRRLRRVRLDAGQFEQVVFNLAVNARDAMPDGGRLSFETANVELDEAFCRAHPELAPGPHVLLRVSDTGTGIAPDLLPHVFEPFFTTKGARGTGLGLASAYGVLRQNRGLIAVESAAGEGTTFRLYVPATGSARERPATQTILPRGVRHATLMLVEDDEGVRRMAARALLEAGYEVFEAKNGQHALEVLARFTGALDLLITDVVMPKMGGPELAQRLSAAYPDLQMLFVSGYTENLVVREGVVKDRINFLAKPFTPRQIKERVRELLARGHAASSSRLKGLDSGEPAGGEP
ncbi:MAG: response regulator [Planctomycetota bacterium]|nr:response regulator [Planctomycetota bacterium]